LVSRKVCNTWSEVGKEKRCIRGGRGLPWGGNVPYGKKAHKRRCWKSHEKPPGGTLVRKTSLGAASVNIEGKGEKGNSEGGIFAGK